MRILLATDGSEQSDAAVDAIARQRFQRGSEIRVISVIGPYMPIMHPLDAVNMNLVEKREKNAREAARTAVEKAVNHLLAGDKSDKLNITTEVLSGWPKVMILDEAEVFGADLIVVGSHGHGMLERFLLGTVAQAVALHAKCSVEIVRGPRSENGRKILLAIDGSEQSAAAVEELTRQPFPDGSELHLISVAELPNMLLPYPEEGIDLRVYGEFERSVYQRANTAVENAAIKLRAGSESNKLTITTDVPCGSPKEVILEEAEVFGADLIVVGSHGYGMVEGFLLGSVSLAVVLHAKCSVEIVRSTEQGEG